MVMESMDEFFVSGVSSKERGVAEKKRKCHRILGI